MAESKSATWGSDKIEIVPGRVVSTHDEAVHLRKYSQEHGLQSILVVTSVYQSRRALWTFRRVFKGSGIVIGLDPLAPGEQSPTSLIYYWVHH